MRILLAIAAAASVLCFGAANAQVHVNGYYRSDGTYVRPHVRSAPDADRSNNYGPSRTTPNYSLNNGYTAPSTRDADRDGIPNYSDRDDDNDGIGDNLDRSQYGSPGSLYNPYRGGN